MSRSVNALTALVFGYVRYGLAIASGFFILPLALRCIDNPTYRQWLVTVEILSYLGFVELGIATLLPWLVAERDGGNDRNALRQLVADARGCCTLSILLFLFIFGTLWILMPGWIGLSEGVSTPLGAGVMLVAICSCVSFFGRVHLAILEGLQDFLFLGGLMLVQSISGLIATIVLLLLGAGPIALAAGIVLPLLIASAGATWRLACRDRELVWGLPWPSRRGMLYLATQASGNWVGGVGGRLMLNSNALFITMSRGTDADVIRFVCTSKLADLLMMQSWQVIDSGLIGLAQLHGEGRRDRVREIIGAMVRLSLIGGGAAAILVLGFNPAFVALWLGPDRFGGLGLNAAIALTLFGLSLVHVLSVTSAILGYRIPVGFVNLVHGLVYAGAAIGLGFLAGPLGVSLAGGLTALLLAIPVLWKLNRLAVAQPEGELARMIFRAWLPRALIPLTAALLLGLSPIGERWELCAPLDAVLLLAYVSLMRPLMDDLPLPRRLQTWTKRLRLVPGTVA